MKCTWGVCLTIFAFCSTRTSGLSFNHILSGKESPIFNHGEIKTAFHNQPYPATEDLPRFPPPGGRQPQLDSLDELQTLPEDERQPDLVTLLEVMRACWRILRYFHQHVIHMNLDSVIGSRIAEAQFKMVLVALEEKAKELTAVDGEWREIAADLRSLHLEAKQLNSVAQPLIKAAFPDSYRELGTLLEPGFWEVSLSTKLFKDTGKPLSRSSRVLKGVEQFVEFQSDKCMSEIGAAVASGGEGDHIDEAEISIGAKKCFVTKECWNLMTKPGYSGYSITHEVLYIVVGYQVGCGEEEERMAQLTPRNGTTMTIATLLENLCYSIFNEAYTIAEAGFPETRRDLFMEQGAVCGLIGYRDFFRKQWLDKVLSWQKPSGCFGDILLYYATHKHKSADGNATLPQHIRPKREEAPMPGHCLAHRSTVALGYLSMYVRYLTLALLK